MKLLSEVFFFKKIIIIFLFMRANEITLHVPLLARAGCEL